MDREKFLQKILKEVMRINGGPVSGKGHPAACLYFSGGIGCVTVIVYEDGWAADEREDKNFVFELDDKLFDTDESLMKKYNQLRAYSFYLKHRRRRK